MREELLSLNDNQKLFCSKVEFRAWLDKGELRVKYKSPLFLRDSFLRAIGTRDDLFNSVNKKQDMVGIYLSVFKILAKKLNPHRIGIVLDKDVESKIFS